MLRVANDRAVDLQLDRVGAGAAVERVEGHELAGHQCDRVGGVAADEMLDAGHRGPREVDDGRRPEQAERIVAAPAVAQAPASSAVLAG